MILIENSWVICCSLLSFQYFCFLRFLILFNICFKWFCAAKVCTCLVEGTGAVLLSLHLFHSLGLCRELCVVQERGLQSVLSLDLKSLVRVDDANRFKERRRQLELSSTCETLEINKWMRKTGHCKHIWYCAEVSPKPQCCCIFNALAKFHLQISLIYSCRSRMASPQESLLSGS